MRAYNALVIDADHYADNVGGRGEQVNANQSMVRVREA
jgi:hypothetical protein